MYLREEASVQPHRTLALAVWDQYGWIPKRSEGKFRFAVFFPSIGWQFLNRNYLAPNVTPKQITSPHPSHISLYVLCIVHNGQ
jgi:hypothetical protein